MRTKGIFLTVLSAIIYGFTPVLCSITYSYGNNPITLTFFRGFIILPILTGLMLKDKISFKCSLDDLIKIFFVALFGSVITTLLLYSSYQYLDVGTSTTLHFMYPLFVTLICHYAYKDVLTKRHIIALVLALIGIATFINFNDFNKIKGILFALTSGITFSIYLVGIEKLKLSKMNDYKLSFYLALVMTISLFTFGTFTKQLVFNQPIQSYALIICVAILAQLIAVICLKKGIGYLGSSLASMFSMFEPVSSVIFGFMFLNESITVLKIIGCCLILGGVSLLIKK